MPQTTVQVQTQWSRPRVHHRRRFPPIRNSPKEPQKSEFPRASKLRASQNTRSHPNAARRAGIGTLRGEFTFGEPKLPIQRSECCSDTTLRTIQGHQLQSHTECSPRSTPSAQSRGYILWMDVQPSATPQTQANTFRATPSVPRGAHQVLNQEATHCGCMFSQQRTVAGQHLQSHTECSSRSTTKTVLNHRSTPQTKVLNQEATSRGCMSDLNRSTSRGECLPNIFRATECSSRSPPSAQS